MGKRIILESTPGNPLQGGERGGWISVPLPGGVRGGSDFSSPPGRGKGWVGFQFPSREG